MSLLLFLLIISSMITPNLKTSDYTENTPPLHILEPCTHFLDTKISIFFLIFIKKTNKKRNKRRSGLLCSYNSLGAIYILVFTTDPCHSKIQYFGNHVMVQQHITRLQVLVNNFKCRVLTKI